MKLAMPVWDNCVSTVLDFSESLLVVDCESGDGDTRYRTAFEGNTIMEKVARLKELHIQVLLCGAVSRPLEQMIRASGIEIIPFLKGKADDVLTAYFSGHPLEPGFMLPGCRRGSGIGRGMGRRRYGYSYANKRKGWNI